MICGLDEAGRGPLAGPVCAAAVILPEDFPKECLRDSKKLSQKERKYAEDIIRDRAMWSLGWADHKEIDEINILQASLLAMKRAFETLALPENIQNLSAIVDGLYTPDIAIPCKAIVKADDKIYEVMAASILAKTARDKEMERYAELYPEYGYERHKGYPTKEHREKIGIYGPSPIQRKTFKVK
jgi:ribonuclease HII